MASWPEFRPIRLLRSLTEQGVDFVVVGGFAVITQGSARLTDDLDICFADDPANLEALGKVLQGLKARLRGVDEEAPFVPDAATLRRVELLTLDTSEGPLDLLRAPPGAPPYGTLRRQADPIELEDFVVSVASVDDLLAMKRTSARPVDLTDVESLEAIKRLSR